MDKQQMSMPPESFGPYEDEIELMDLLKVLWKWKYLIIFGSLACAVIAAIVSFSMTPVYRVDTVLSPGVAKVDANGKVSYIGSPQEIKTLIDTGALENAVLEKVKGPEGEELERVDFEVKQAKGSSALEVSYETPDVALGKEILGALNEALFWKFDGIVQYFKEEYAVQIGAKVKENSSVVEKIDGAKSDILNLQAETLSKISEMEAKISLKRSEMATNISKKDKLVSDLETQILAKQSEMSIKESEKEDKISKVENHISAKKSEIEKNKAQKLAAVEQKKSSIATLKSQIRGKEKQIANLEKRIKEVSEEIKRIATNTDFLIKERDKFLASAKNENNILASVMYTNTIQQNIGYLNDLRSTVSSINYQILKENMGIEKLENDIADLKTQVTDVEVQTRIKNTQILADVMSLESQKANIKKQTKTEIEKLLADIKDLQSQIANVEKLATYKNDALKSDIKDFESQIQSMKAQRDSQIKRLNSQITALESGKAFIQEEIKNLRFKKDYVQNIQILQPPQSSLGPVKPKKKLNVLLAGVVGLFLTVFAAFFVEYISKHKDE